MKRLVFASLFLGAAFIAVPQAVAAQSSETSDGAQAGSDAADAVIAQMDQQQLRQQLLDRRIDICREAIKVEDWPSYVIKEIDADSSLGPRTDFLEVCLIYLHGRRDTLIEQRDELVHTLKAQ
jgi:hypothetical protein